MYLEGATGDSVGKWLRQTARGEVERFSWSRYTVAHWRWRWHWRVAIAGPRIKVAAEEDSLIAGG